MRIDLIYCGIGVAGFNAKRKAGDLEGSWISHGLSLIGAVTKKAGHNVNLIDLRQLRGWKHLGKIIKANPADVYGLQISPVDYLTGLSAVYEVKKNAPKAKIIVGGIQPTIFPEKFSKFKAIDCVVQGEGEITFPKLLENIDNLPRVIRGERPDLDAIPWADRGLWQYWREMTCTFAPNQALPSVTMLAGRGCPYKCSYCQPAENSVFGSPFRMRSVDNVMGEIDQLYHRYRFQSIIFWDDTFTFSPKWIDQFCDSYKYKAELLACSRADIICNHENMIGRLASVGLKWLVIGMESGSQRLLDFIEKGTTVEQNIRAAQICRKYGIKIFASYMYGLPTETREDAELTYRMIKEIAPEHPSPFWYVPIPGTKLGDYCRQNDLLLEPWDDSKSIERTGRYLPYLKGVNYKHLLKICERNRREKLRKEECHENQTVSRQRAQRKSVHRPAGILPGFETRMAGGPLVGEPGNK